MFKNPLFRFAVKSTRKNLASLLHVRNNRYSSVPDGNIVGDRKF